eukprot:495362_1
MSDLTVVQNFLLSGVAAAVSKTVASPFKNVKQIQQARNIVLQSDQFDNDKIPDYLLTDDWFPVLMYNIVQDKGISGLFAGNLMGIARYFPTQMLNFMFKNKIKSIFKSSKNDGYAMKLSKNVAAGGVAGAISLLFVYPMDTMYEKQSVNYYYNQDDETDKKEQEQSFISKYYSGIGISIVGIIVYRGIYFGLYDILSANIKTDNPKQKYAMGYAVTVCAGLISYPLDSIRRRQMLTGENVNDAYCNIVQQNGIISLWDGAMLNIFRGMIGAFALSIYNNYIVKKT